MSAKKYADDADLTVKIDQSDPNAAVAITTLKSKLDQYPYAYRDLVQRIKEQRSQATTRTIDEVIKKYNIKTDRRLAAYSFRTKTQEEAFNQNKITAKGLTSIYNENAVRFILDKIAN